MLTDTRVRQAKPRNRPVKLTDSGGLHLLIQPTGGKLWRQSYRFGGKQKTLALGVYPTVGLKAAREQREAAKQLLAKGVDPSEQRKRVKQTAVYASANTFRAVAEELIAKHEREGLAEATLVKRRWLAEFAYPALGARPVSEIEAPEILAVLRAIEERQRYESAKRLRALCGMVFRYAIATGRAKRDPAADLRGALTSPKVTHRAAIIDPKKIGELLRAIDGYDGFGPTRAALQLLALTFVRPGELRHAEWSEFDMQAAIWRIPAAKMKMKTEHRVPLSRQAIAVIERVRAMTGYAKWLFPATHTSLRPMSENTLNAALRRLSYAKGEMTAHGFRTMASTRLNEMQQFSPDAIERQLAHQDGDAIRRAYNSAQYWPERVTMMQRWADYLDGLRNNDNHKAAA
jgi:integrase